MCLHYRYQMVIASREIIAIYSKNHTKPINTLLGQSAEFLKVKAGYIYHNQSQDEAPMCPGQGLKIMAHPLSPCMSP